MSQPLDEFGKSVARELSPAERDRILDKLGQGIASRFDHRLNDEAIGQALDFYLGSDSRRADSHWLPMALHPSPETREKLIAHVCKLALEGDAAATAFLLNLSLHFLAEKIEPPALLCEAARAFLSGELKKCPDETGRPKVYDMDERTASAVYYWWAYMPKAEAIGRVAEYRRKSHDAIKTAIRRNVIRTGMTRTKPERIKA